MKVLSGVKTRKRSDIRRLSSEAEDQVIFWRWCNRVHWRGSLVDAFVVKSNSPYTQHLVFHSICAPISRLNNLTYLETYISNPDISSEEKIHTPSFRYASFIVPSPHGSDWHLHPSRCSCQKPSDLQSCPSSIRHIQSVASSCKFYLQRQLKLSCVSIPLLSLLSNLSTWIHFCLGSLQSFLHTTVRWYFKVLNLKSFLWMEPFINLKLH